MAGVDCAAVRKGMLPPSELMAGSQRIKSIDAVRATALLLILLAHCVVAYGAQHVDGDGAADSVAWWFFDYVFLGNGFLMFSFLFGLSFFFQMDHAEAKGIDFRGRFCWRLVLLLVFGIIHNAFYRSDILMIFALAGFVPVLYHKVRTKWILLACVLLLVQPVPLIEAVQRYVGTWVEPPHDPAVDPASLWDAMRANSTKWLVWKAQYQWDSGRLFYTLAMFMLGTVTGRLRIFERPRAQYLPRIAAWGAVFMAVMLCVEAAVPETEAFSGFHGYVQNWRQVATVCCFIPLLAWLYDRPCLQRFLRPLYSVGRCTLTAYITQGIILTLLFFQYGLGWGICTTAADRVLIGLVFFAAQTAFFTWWLGRFKYGPLEGVWRRLTRIGMKQG